MKYKIRRSGGGDDYGMLSNTTYSSRREAKKIADDLNNSDMLYYFEVVPMIFGTAFDSGFFLLVPAVLFILFWIGYAILTFLGII